MVGWAYQHGGALRGAAGWSSQPHSGRWAKTNVAQRASQQPASSHHRVLTLDCRSLTSSTPTISPLPRTSPMMSCRSCSCLQVRRGRNGLGPAQDKPCHEQHSSRL